MRAWRLDRRTIAVVADFGEPQFRSFRETLGLPVARYFSPETKRECSRQWYVRRGASAVVFLGLLRQLREQPDNEVMQIRRTRAPRRVMVATEAA